MGGQRQQTNVTTDERKEKMKANYHANKDRLNRNKIINELETNKRLFVKEDTLQKYNWTADQLSIIDKFNQQYKKERTVPRPVIVKPKPVIVQDEQSLPTSQPVIYSNDGTYHEDVAKAYLERRKEERNLKDSTVKNSVSKIKKLLKLFNVTNGDLMEIYNKLTIKQIRETIEANPNWKSLNTKKGYVGFGGLLAFDKRFRDIIGEDKAKELQRDFKNIRDDSNIESQKQRETVSSNYRSEFFGIFEKANDNVYKKGTLKHALTMLYTHGMYSDMTSWKSTPDKLIIVPRNYFHTVLLIDDQKENDKRQNFYIPKEGRMILNDFKSSHSFDFNYVLPNEVKEAVNTYIEKNKNNTYMIEKKIGGLFSPSQLGTTIKQALGLNISTMRKAVENYEVHAKGSDREKVAVAMGHTKRTQDQQYLDKLHFEDKLKYVGMRVKVRVEQGRNKDKIVIGTVGLNMDENPDIPSEKMPFSITFDKEYNEEPEYMDLPDPDVELFEAKDLPPKTPQQMTLNKQRSLALLKKKKQHNYGPKPRTRSQALQILKNKTKQ